VEVTGTRRQHEVDTLLAHNNLLNSVDIWMSVYEIVRGEKTLTCRVSIHHLTNIFLVSLNMKTSMKGSSFHFLQQQVLAAQKRGRLALSPRVTGQQRGRQRGTVVHADCATGTVSVVWGRWQKAARRIRR